MRLWDLPRVDRDALLDELVARLAGVPEAVHPERELGPAPDFAADLRDAAGFPRRPSVRAKFRNASPWRRRAWLGTFAVIILLAAALTTAGVWIGRLQPLQNAGMSGVLPASIVRSETLGTGESDVLIDYRDGATVRYLVDVYNNGPVDIRILRVGTPPGRFFNPLPADRVYVGSAEVPTGDAEHPLRPFRPTLLPAGQEQVSVVEGRLVDCAEYTHGSVVSFDQVPVRYDVLGLHRTQDLRLMTPTAIRMPGPGTPRCPHSRGR